MFIFLWSDILIWALLFCTALLLIKARHKAHYRAALARVLASKSAMASATLLLCFVGIALLDSLHFRPPIESENQDKNAPMAYATTVLSALDVLAKPLRTRLEKSYSAPFALYSLAKETREITAENGQKITVRDTPRLQFGGAHLGVPSGVHLDKNAEKNAHRADLQQRFLAAFAWVFLAWMMIGALAVLFIAKSAQCSAKKAAKKLIKGDTKVAWNAILLTFGVLLFIFLPLILLSSEYHVFGTDKVGVSVLYQILKSIRTALLIGLLTTLITLPIAIFFGIFAGFFKGWVDDLIQYIYTTISAIPSVLLIAASVLMMQVIMDAHAEWFATATERADVRLIALCAILGLTSWTSLCRLLRGETLKLRELDYVQAAKAFGVTDIKIIFRHILPNLMHLIIIALVMDFSGLVLAEAVLSYIGIGVDPSMISFGTMINNARMELARDPMVWWALSATFVFMLALVLSANLFADALQKAFDPRLQR